MKELINDIIKKRYPFEHTKNIAKDLNMSENAVYNRAFYMNLKKDPQYLKTTQFQKGSNVGLATQFKPGNVPTNKGKKMSKETYEKVSKSFFKKNNKPANWMPNGTLNWRIDKCNRRYQYIKISNCNWKLYSRYVWEQAHGDIPKGMIIIFADKNTENCNLDNLRMISYKKNMLINSIHNYPTEIQQLIKLNNKLKNKIHGQK